MAATRFLKRTLVLWKLGMVSNNGSPREIGPKLLERFSRFDTLISTDYRKCEPFQ